MKLSELKAPKGATRAPKRKGRGTASGNGTTAGRGMNGQKSRSGGGVRLGFEGGQMPLYRRLPKRGFKCYNSKDIVAIDITRLEKFEDGATVDVQALKEIGIIKESRDGVKIIGCGDLSKKLNVKVDAYSASAKAKIEAAGGTAEVAE